MAKTWIGVDLDGTLAKWDGSHWTPEVGEPVKPMVDKVRVWLNRGEDVRIFTARVWPLGVVASGASKERRKEAEEQYVKVQDWCKKIFGRRLPITCIKDPTMKEIYDDRAYHVERNTGEIL